MEAAASKGQLPRGGGGGVNYGQDFFGEKAFLTVSGQLNGGAARARAAFVECRWLCNAQHPFPPLPECQTSP